MRTTQRLIFCDKMVGDDESRINFADTIGEEDKHWGLLVLLSSKTTEDIIAVGSLTCEEGRE